MVKCSHCDKSGRYGMLYCTATGCYVCDDCEANHREMHGHAKMGHMHATKAGGAAAFKKHYLAEQRRLGR